MSVDKVKICFNGCSFTVGEGFAIEDREKYIYDRLIANEFNVDRINIAQGGSNNYKIFMRSADAILNKNFDIVVTQWSALNRVWFSPGPDCVFFTNDNRYPDFRYRDLYLSKEEKQKFKDTALMLNHDYQNIIDLIDYCKILSSLAKLNSKKIIFINGLVPWTDDLARPLDTDLNSSLSKYSKSILDFDNRSDEEIIKFFKELQNKFKELEPSLWVNLFDSFYGNQVDIGPEGHHPGIQSHKWMADKVSKYIKERKLI